MKKLIAIKNLIEADDNYFIVTTNKETHQEGTATFLRNNKEIRVYEGKPDGSDDHNVTYEEFIKKYEFEVLY